MFRFCVSLFLLVALAFFAVVLSEPCSGRRGRLQRVLERAAQTPSDRMFSLKSALVNILEPKHCDFAKKHYALR